MPIDYSTYHPKWRLISYLIRVRRANNRCEKCGVANGAFIRRGRGDSYTTPGAQEWDMIHSYKKNNACTFLQAVKHFGFIRVVLTVAHLDHDKNNNRFWNLMAKCQRCHLIHDIYQHAANRKYGRNWKDNQLKLEL
jgi:hypothetical protein